MRGLQIFVNLATRHKMLPPAVISLKPHEVPVWLDGKGNTIRVVVGHYANVVSPAQPVEPFDLLDASVSSPMELALDPSRNTLLYAAVGRLTVIAGSQQATLGEGDAMALRGADRIKLDPLEHAQLVVLAGTPTNDPVVQQGPFIMESEQAMRDAIARYGRGDMGTLRALHY